MEQPQRHYSTGTLYKRRKFEIHYEPNYLPNRPVHARLHHCQQPFGGAYHCHCDSECMAPAYALFQQMVRDEHVIDDDEGRPLLVRSMSMPQLTQEELLRQQMENSTSCNSSTHSRKSSLVSNCTHLQELCEKEEDACHRHHHRRGSVAIKFDERKAGTQ